MSITVSTSSFLEVMRAKWREYGNVLSPALEQAWMQIAETMNRQVTKPLQPRPVIPAELGAGKTTCAKLWCSMLPLDQHPGVLIVARTIDQANEYANDINCWASSDAALAYHSDLKPRPKPEVIAQYPTLIVCHRGYELALDELLVEEPERYAKLMRFRTGRRRLVIVDEALDQVYVAHIRQSALRSLTRVHPRILKQHLGAVDVIESANRALIEAPENGLRVVSSEELLARTQLTADQADNELLALWEGVKRSKLVKPKERQILKETLTALRRHLAAYRFTESDRRERSMIGVRLLLPPDAGQVFLDATGALNNVYIRKPADYEVQNMPAVRNYGSVTLHVARTRGTGKTAMLKDGPSIIQQALDSVLSHYGDRAAQRQVLVVTDLGSEDKVREIWSRSSFKSFDVAHWNAIDGRNDWREYDTLVVLNLPWARLSTDVSTFMAVGGFELNDEHLNAPPDDVKVIRETRIAAQLAQAMGRIRLRRMTTENGTCEPCDIFVRFPHWSLLADTDRIVAGVQRALAGIQIVPWSDASTKLVRTNRPAISVTGVGAQLLGFVKQMQPDSIVPVSEVREQIGATAHGTWFRVQKNPIVLAMLKELSARIEPAIGRRPAQLVKGDVAVRNLIKTELSRRYRAECRRRRTTSP